MENVLNKLQEINANDLIVEAYPAPPKTGMLTGDMPAGIKITHKPTGKSAICEAYREQWKNKASALADIRYQLCT